MKRLLILWLALVGLSSCHYNTYDPDYDKSHNPYFRSQYTAIEENGTFVEPNEIIFDFDLYNNKSLTIFKKNDYRNGNKQTLTVQSYSVNRVSEITWVIENYYYNENYCDIVIQSSSYNVDKINYAELVIYQNNFVIDRYTISRIHNIIDINGLVVAD